MSVYVIRAFIERRETLAANAAILKRLAEIDKTLLEHDTALREITRNLCRCCGRRLNPSGSESDFTQNNERGQQFFVISSEIRRVSPAM
jgi:hypothetical protein